MLPEGLSEIEQIGEHAGVSLISVSFSKEIVQH